MTGSISAWCMLLFYQSWNYQSCSYYIFGLPFMFLLYFLIVKKIKLRINMLDRSIIGYIYWNLIILGINGLCCFHYSYQLQILISFIKCPTYFSPVHFLHNLNNNSLLYAHLEFPFKCLIALIVKIPIIWILFIVFQT